LFFNERLELEKIRRNKFVESRSNGKAGRKKSYDKSYDNHMVNHTENRNENENRNVIISKETEIFTIEHCAVVALNDDRWVRANKADEKNLLEFNAFLEKQGIYQRNPMDYKRHFANWTKKQKDGTTKKGTSEARIDAAEEF
jgi:hypothetical protein